MSKHGDYFDVNKRIHLGKTFINKTQEDSEQTRVKEIVKDSDDCLETDNVLCKMNCDLKIDLEILDSYSKIHGKQNKENEDCIYISKQCVEIPNNSMQNLEEGQNCSEDFIVLKHDANLDITKASSENVNVENKSANLDRTKASIDNFIAENNTEDFIALKHDANLDITKDSNDNDDKSANLDITKDSSKNLDIENKSANLDKTKASSDNVNVENKSANLDKRRASSENVNVENKREKLDKTKASSENVNVENKSANLDKRKASSENVNVENKCANLDKTKSSSENVDVKNKRENLDMTKASSENVIFLNNNKNLDIAMTSSENANYLNKKGDLYTKMFYSQENVVVLNKKESYVGIQTSSKSNIMNKDTLEAQKFEEYFSVSEGICHVCEREKLSIKTCTERTWMKKNAEDIHQDTEFLKFIPPWPSLKKPVLVFFQSILYMIFGPLLFENSEDEARTKVQYLIGSGITYVGASKSVQSKRTICNRRPEKKRQTNTFSLGSSFLMLTTLFMMLGKTNGCTFTKNVTGSDGRDSSISIQVCYSTECNGNSERWDRIKDHKLDVIYLNAFFGGSNMSEERYSLERSNNCSKLSIRNVTEEEIFNDEYQFVKGTSDKTGIIKLNHEPILIGDETKCFIRSSEKGPLLVLKMAVKHGTAGVSFYLEFMGMTRNLTVNTSKMDFWYKSIIEITLDFSSQNGTWNALKVLYLFGNHPICVLNKLLDDMKCEKEGNMGKDDSKSLWSLMCLIVVPVGAIVFMYWKKILCFNRCKKKRPNADRDETERESHSMLPETGT